MAMMRYPQMGHAFGRKEGLTGPFLLAAESEEMQVIITSCFATLQLISVREKKNGAAPGRRRCRRESADN
jgi:hypothetical protein